MTNETLRIIGGGRQVWLRARDAVTEVVRETELVDYQLAGAGVLSAKYSHRESMDIDVVLTDTGQENRGLHAMRTIANRTNATIHPVGGDIYQLRFSDMPEENHIDIFIRTEHGHDGDRLSIEGREEPALTTTEVLYGKLMERGHKGWVRDAIDIAVVNEEDPRELEQAINALPARIWAKTISEIGKAGPGYADALERMQLHSNTAKRAAKELALVAQLAAKHARYSIFDLDMKDNMVILYTESRRNGPASRRWSSTKETAPLLRRHWYDLAIAVRGESVDNVVKRANRSIRDGTTDRINIRCEPVMRRALPAAGRPGSTYRKNDYTKSRGPAR